MIPYKEIKKLVRFKERDNDEVKLSDYEIKAALNEVVRMLSLAQALNNSDFLEKVRFYKDDSCNCEHHHFHGALLPVDFVTLIAVEAKNGEILRPCLSWQQPKMGEYKVSADRIYCSAPDFKIVYKATLIEVDDEEDEIDLPNIFKDMLVNLTRMVLNGADVDILREAVEQSVNEVIPRRRYAYAKIAMPFKI